MKIKGFSRHKPTISQAFGKARLKAIIFLTAVPALFAVLFLNLDYSPPHSPQLISNILLRSDSSPAQTNLQNISSKGFVTLGPGGFPTIIAANGRGELVLNSLPASTFNQYANVSNGIVDSLQRANLLPAVVRISIKVGQITESGSGFIVKTPDGRFSLVTAGHVLPDEVRKGDMVSMDLASYGGPFDALWDGPDSPSPHFLTARVLEMRDVRPTGYSLYEAWKGDYALLDLGTSIPSGFHAFQVGSTPQPGSRLISVGFPDLDVTGGTIAVGNGWRFVDAVATGSTYSAGGLALAPDANENYGMPPWDGQSGAVLLNPDTFEVVGIVTQGNKGSIIYEGSYHEISDSSAFVIASPIRLCSSCEHGLDFTPRPGSLSLSQMDQWGVRLPSLAFESSEAQDFRFTPSNNLPIFTLSDLNFKGDNLFLMASDLEIQAAVLGFNDSRVQAGLVSYERSYLGLSNLYDAYRDILTSSSSGTATPIDGDGNATGSPIDQSSTAPAPLFTDPLVSTTAAFLNDLPPDTLTQTLSEGQPEPQGPYTVDDPNSTHVGAIPSDIPNAISGVAVQNPPPAPRRKCFVNVDLNCGRPLSIVSGLPWIVRTKEMRQALLSSSDVQRNERNCALFAETIKTECAIKAPVVSVFYPNADAVTKTVNYAITADKLIPSRANLPTAFKAYFSNTSLLAGDVTPQQLAAIKQFASPFSSSTTLVLKMPCQAGNNPYNNVSECGFLAVCTGSVDPNIGDTLTISKQPLDYGEWCTAAQAELALSGIIDEVYGSANTPYSSSLSIRRQPVSGYKAFTQMPLLNQVDGWLQGIFIDKFNYNYPVEKGICSATATTMMAVGLKSISPYTKMGNVFDSLNPIQTVSTPSGTKKYRNYAVHVEKMTEELGLLWKPGKLSVPDQWWDVASEAEYSNGVNGAINLSNCEFGLGRLGLCRAHEKWHSNRGTFLNFGSTYMGLNLETWSWSSASDINSQILTSIRSLFNYNGGLNINQNVKSHLKRLISSGNGVTLAVFSPNFFIPDSSGIAFQESVGHALAVQGISGEQITIFDPWKRVYHVRFADIGMIITPEYYPGLVNVSGNIGYIGTPFSSGEPAPVRYSDGSTASINSTYAFIIGMFTSPRFPITDLAAYRASLGKVSPGQSLSNDREKCTPQTVGSIVVGGKTYRFKNSQLSGEVTYPCRDFLEGSNGPLKDFLGTFSAKCNGGVMSVKQNRCGAAVPAPRSCSVQYGTGTLLPHLVPGTPPYFDRISCMATCLPGFTVDRTGSSCSCTFKDVVSGAAIAGVVKDGNQCKFAGCPAGKVRSRSGKIACFEVGDACDFSNSNYVTANGAIDPHAHLYTVRSSGYCQIATCRSGYVVSSDGGACVRPICTPTLNTNCTPPAAKREIKDSAVKKTGCSDAGSDGAVVTCGTSFRAEAEIYGTYLKLVAKVGPNRGIARISIDSRPPILIDLYETSPRKADIPIAVGAREALVSDPRVHRVAIEYTGEKNAASTGATLALYSVESYTPTTMEFKSQIVTKSGCWRTGADGTIVACETNFSTTAWVFGKNLKLITKAGPNLGIARVKVDNSPPVLVDLYATNKAGKEVQIATGLVNRLHKVSIEHAGIHNAKSSGNDLVLKALSGL